MMVFEGRPSCSPLLVLGAVAYGILISSPAYGSAMESNWRFSVQVWSTLNPKA